LHCPHHSYKQDWGNEVVEGRGGASHVQLELDVLLLLEEVVEWDARRELGIQLVRDALGAAAFAIAGVALEKPVADEDHAHGVALGDEVEIAQVSESREGGDWERGWALG
jgi:hypothetical protein